MLPQHLLSAKVREPVAGRSSAGARTATLPPPASDADLQYASHLGVGGGVGDGRLSLRGSVEGAAALVDALDAETCWTGPGGGEASVAHQRAPDRPPAASPQGARPTPALCADQARP